MSDARINRVFQLQDKLNLEIVDHIKKYSEQSRVYPLQPSHLQKQGLILTKSGVLVREQDEGHLIPIKEHRQALLDAYIKLFEALYDNLKNKLFALSERTMYELVTSTMFIELSSLFTRKEKERIATVLMLQQNKSINRSVENNKIIKDKLNILTKEDKDYKSKDFDKHVSRLLNTFPSRHPRARTRIFDMFMGSRKQYRMHLNFRLHARTISLNEALGLSRPKAQKMRHQTFLIYCGLQVLDYIPKSSSNKILDNPLKKFQDNFVEIRKVFNWLSEKNL